MAGIGHLSVKSKEIEPEIVRVKPSSAFRLHRDEIRRLVQQSRASNPRVFGSVLRGRDTECGSDAHPHQLPLGMAAIDGYHGND
jgi:hypothetical protein